MVTLKSRTYLLSVGPTGRGEQEVGEVGGGAEELRAVEVDDDALGGVVLEYENGFRFSPFMALPVFYFNYLEHEVAHPHVAVADGVEARAEGVAGAPQLHQQLEHLVRDLPQLQHVLLNACRKKEESQKFESGAESFAFTG